MKVWIHINGLQEGPFMLENLPLDRMSFDTPVWYNGLPDWMPASEAPEVARILVPYLQQSETIPLAPAPPQDIIEEEETDECEIEVNDAEQPRPENNRPSHPQQGPQQRPGFPQQGPMPGPGCPQQGPMPGPGYPQQGPMPGPGYPQQGPMPGPGYPQQGPMPGPGYPQQGFPRPGFQPQGCPQPNWQPRPEPIPQPQPMPQQFGAPTDKDGKPLPCPPNYLIASIILTVICCNPVGIGAIIYGMGVKSKFNAGDLEGAKRASETTEWWLMATIVTGLILSCCGWLIF